MVSRRFKAKEHSGPLAVPIGSRHAQGVSKRTNAEIGARVRARRIELKLTPSELLTKADIDAKTLQRLEDGTRWPIERTRRRIEEVLAWSPGGIDAIRDGDEPTPLPRIDVGYPPQPAKLSAEGTLSAEVRGYINPTREQLEELNDALTQLSYAIILLATNQPAQGVAILTGARATLDGIIRRLTAAQSPEPPGVTGIGCIDGGRQRREEIRPGEESAPR